MPASATVYKRAFDVSLWCSKIKIVSLFTMLSMIWFGSQRAWSAGTLTCVCCWATVLVNSVNF